MASQKVLLREKYLKSKRLYKLGKISKVEFNRIKNAYERGIAYQNLKSLEKYEQAVKSGQATGNLENIQTTKEQLIKKISTPQDQQQQQTQVVAVKDQYERVYTGKEVGGRFIGVRPVTKIEQQRRANIKAGYSFFPNSSKTKAQVVAEQTAVRAGLGIYLAPSTIKQDVKFNFERVETETPPPPTQAEIDRNVFKMIGEAGKQTVSFYTSSFRGIGKSAATVMYELEKSKGSDLSKAPEFVNKFYDYRYKTKQEFTSDLTKIGILSTPFIFQSSNILSNIAKTKAGQLSFKTAEAGLYGYAGYRFITKPSSETLSDVFILSSFQSYAKYGESLASFYGRGATKFNDYLTNYKIYIEAPALDKAARIGGRPARIRAGVKSKAQMRQESYGIYKNQKMFYDKGEIGVKIRSPELKAQQFTKERVIRYGATPKGIEVTSVKDVQLGGRGSLTTTRDLNYIGKGSKPNFRKLYPQGYGSQSLKYTNIKVVDQSLVGITIQRSGRVSFMQPPPRPKTVTPVKSLPRQYTKNINVKSGGSKGTNTIQVTKFPETPYIEPPQTTQIGGFRKGVTEKLIKNVRLKIDTKIRTEFIKDLSKGSSLLPPANFKTTTPSLTTSLTLENPAKVYKYSELSLYPKLLTSQETEQVSGQRLRMRTATAIALDSATISTQKPLSATIVLTRQAQDQRLAQDTTLLTRQTIRTKQKQPSILQFKERITPKIEPIQDYKPKYEFKPTTRPRPKPTPKIKTPNPPKFKLSFSKKSTKPFSLNLKPFKVAQPKPPNVTLRSSFFGLKGQTIGFKSGIGERYEDILTKKKKNSLWRF